MEQIHFQTQTATKSQGKITLTKMVHPRNALLAVTGMTIPLVAGVAGFIKDELRRPPAIERKS